VAMGVEKEKLSIFAAEKPVEAGLFLCCHELSRTFSLDMT
jgi:hypothetical protein